MIRRTLGDVKSELARIAGACGMQASDPRVIDYINYGTEELMNDGDYPFLFDRLTFQHYGGTVTLPAKYDRIAHCNVNNCPQLMQSSWFEYTGNGPYSSNSDYDSGTSYYGVLDKDEVITYIDIPGTSTANTAWDSGYSLGFGSGLTYRIRLETQVDERISGDLPDNCIVRGNNIAGEWIRTGSGGIWIDGEELQWQIGSGHVGTIQYAESTESFISLTSALKPLTNKAIKVYAIPSDGSANIQIGLWEHNTTRPSYRRYKISGLSSDNDYTVDARCRRRFIPISNDNDELIISNMQALRNMVLFVWYNETGKLQEYAAHKQIAIDILNSEAKAYRGNNKRPVVTFADYSKERYRV